MKARAAALGSLGGAKTRQRAGKQNTCEKRLHVFSLPSRPQCGGRTMIHAARFGNAEDRVVIPGRSPFWRANPESGSYTSLLDSGSARFARIPE
jgi:hypothetical protein